MATSFYFYDLETTGITPRTSRIMQFAGQRTTLDLEAITEPQDFLIKLTQDVLPDPQAVLLTGITPQKTLSEGLTEAEFLKKFYEEIVTPDTIFVGYNSIRFDDEFMRYLHYRNFYDPYEWQWQDGRSKWDLLDVVRMTRALRPEGINWPMGPKGKASNRLELLTELNNLDHSQAHNALNDVMASIALARLVRDKQPKLFDWLLSMRDKKKVAQFVQNNEMFIYTSGTYPSETEKTTIVTVLADHPDRQSVFVYDLRHDPAQFASMTPAELAEAWKRRKSEEGPQLPIKAMPFNRCPAVAPLGVLDSDAQDRLKIDMDQIEKHHIQLTILKDWTKRVLEAYKLLDQERQTNLLIDERTVDEQLYDGFFDKPDRTTMSALRVSEPKEISDFSDKFTDQRLKALLPLYKARNFSKYLTDEERRIWESYRRERLLAGDEESRMGKFFKRLSDLSLKPGLTPNQRYLLEELELYAQSILPDD